MSRGAAVFLALVLVAGCGRPDPRLERPLPTLPPSIVEEVEVASDFGVDSEAIRIGILADLSGPAATRDVPHVDAQKLFWAEVNGAGGIGGRQVELEVIDTGSDLEAHRRGYQQLVDDVGVVAIGFSSGTETTLAIGPLAVVDQVVVVTGSRHSAMITQPAVLAPHTSLCVEAMNSVSWVDQRVRAVTNDELRLAIVGDGTPDADDAVAGARLSAVALELKVVLDHTGSDDLGARLQSAGASGVFVAGRPGFLEAALSESELPLAIWTGSSLNLDVHAFAERTISTEVNERYFHPWPISVRGLGDSDVTRVADSLSASGSMPSNWSLLGWAGASLLFDALSQGTARGDLQRQTVLDIATTLRARFEGLAPDQTWRGSRADRIVRETTIYDLVDWGDPATVQLVAAGGPEPSDHAEAFQQSGACLASPVPPPTEAPAPENQAADEELEAE